MTLEQIDKDPLKDKEVFAKAQQIVQTIKLLSKSIQSDESDTIKTKKSFNHIMNQIALSVKEDTISADLNISNVIEKLESTPYDDVSINIPSDIKDFVKNFNNEIKIKAGSTLDTNNLSSLQNGLNEYGNKAKENIKNKTISKLKDIIEEVKATTTTILANKKEAFIIPDHIDVDKNIS